MEEETKPVIPSEEPQTTIELPNAQPIDEPAESNLRVTAKMKESLLSSMNWLKIITIITCANIGILTLAIIVLIIWMAINPTSFSDAIKMQLVSLCNTYLVVGCIYVYPIIKSFHLISHTRQALKQGIIKDFELATKDWHSLMKYMGILTIVIISLFVLLIVFIIIFIIIVGLSAKSRVGEEPIV